MWPILGNRPIDQWKVIELKEELKRRKLPLRGLKDDLIRRLDEALRNEKESIQRVEVADPKPELQFVDADGMPVVETAKNMDQGDSVAKAAINSVEQAGPYVNVLASPQGKERGGKVTNVPVSVQEVVDTGIPKPEVEVADADSVPAVETAKNMDQFDSIDKSKATSVEQAGRDVNVVAFPQGKEHDDELTNGPDLVRVVQELVVPELSTDMSTMVFESVVSERGLCDKESQDIEIQKDNGASRRELNKWESAVQLENDDLKLHPKPEDAHPSHMDVMLELSVSNNLVSEVSPTLGTQLKSEYISTDSVSIKEKNELKDNIIADNVILEVDIVKPEIVQPPSSDVQDDGESHNMDVNDPLHCMNVNEPPHPDVSRPVHPSDVSKPSFLLDAINESSHSLDVSEPHENNPVEEINESTAIADIIKKNDSAELVYAEKLNLDRSSGEDSMEEDLLESKQIDSEFIPDEAGDKNEQPAMNILKEDGFVDVVGDDSSACEKEVYINSNLHPAAPAVKRKLHEQGAGKNNEPLKRQRRWNSDSLNAPVPKKPNVAASTTPKDSVQHTVLRRNFSISESVDSEDSTKERIVPPSPKSPTNSLRIDQFLRPFTLKAVQELLGKTGTVVSFWMDHIKTHCYVTYSSVEEAMETRNAVYNLQWPANGGRLLRADFVHPNEVKMRVEGPPQVPAVPACAVPIIAGSEPSPQPSPRNHVSRQHLPPPLHFLPPPPPVLRELPLPPPLPLPRPEKPEPPIVTLDDLFKKTKAIPRIYYLPLSDEQVAAKRAAVGQNVKR